MKHWNSQILSQIERGNVCWSFQFYKRVEDVDT